MEKLIFVSNWIKIHKVIDEIESINLTQIKDFSCFSVKIWGNCCEINMNNQFAMAYPEISDSFHSSFFREETKKIAVIVAINHFIDWYNNNKDKFDNLPK